MLRSFALAAVLAVGGLGSAPLAKAQAKTETEVETATDSAAVEVIGTLEGEFDRIPRTWFVTAEGGKSRSGWHGFDLFQSVTIYGFPVETETEKLPDSLRLRFDLELYDGRLFVENAEIYYTPNGLGTPWQVASVNKTESSVIRVDEVSIDADTLVISGTFGGRLQIGDRMTGAGGITGLGIGGAGALAGSIAEGTRKRREIAGRFAVRLPRR
ncbi:MAG: hypothetical protein AAF675_01305 [Pseudomonadota bacterium]